MPGPSVQLYGLDLVYHLCPRRAYGPLSLDLVQGIKLDLVQSWCISHTNLLSSLRPSGERGSSQEGRFYDGRQIRQKQPNVQDSKSMATAFPSKYAQSAAFGEMAIAKGRSGRHEATCHPRPGGACEAMGPVRERRRGSPVTPGPARRSNPRILAFRFAL